MPVHVPAVLDVSVWPERGGPVTTGSTVFAGAAGSTIAVCAEVATASPSVLRAVTSTRIVAPTSLLVSVCVAAPASGVQAAPAPSQRRHMRVKVTGAAPVQEPFVALRIWPSRTVPATSGSPPGSLTGGASAAIVAVAGEVALAAPSRFVAVTVTRIVLPMSALPSVWVAPPAPAIGAQAAPASSQRCQARP